MGRLSPPVVPAAAARRVDVALEIPLGGIGRKAILAAYYPEMPEPLPDRQTVVKHLARWTVQLSRADWYRETYPQAAIIFRDPNVTALADTAEQVLQACAAHVDPLTRYSAGWVDSLREFEPDTLRGEVATAMREARRTAAGQVVRAMVQEPGVRSSAEALESFIDDQSGRYDADGETVLTAFLGIVDNLLQAGGAGRVVFGPEHLQAIDDYVAALNQLGTDDAVLTDATLAEYRKRAISALEAIVTEDKRLVHDDYLAVAFESLITTYVNKLVRGQPVDDFGPQDVWGRIKSRRLSDEKKAWKEGGLLPDDDYFAGPRNLTTPANPADTLISEVRVVETAVRRLDADPSLRIAGGALCWEAEMVRAELLSELREDDVEQVRKRKFTQRVREAWRQQRPTTARSSSVVAAVLDAEVLLRTTLNRAQRDLEDELGGGEL